MRFSITAVDNTVVVLCAIVLNVVMPGAFSNGEEKSFTTTTKGLRPYGDVT
jgi:hypothetical protein